MAGTEWATMDTVEWGLKDLHVKGTRLRGGAGMDFWMFNPDVPQDGKACRIRCGICKQGMDGFKSCPDCFPWRQEADGDHHLERV
jgi:hypothetical protein